MTISKEPAQFIDPAAQASRVVLVDGAGAPAAGSTAAATGTTTSVASSATAVTLKAANTNRLGLTVYNDSTAVLYVLLGAGTASASVYTVQMAAGAYYEVPFRFTGIVTGLWASVNGNARITEITA